MKSGLMKLPRLSSTLSFYQNFSEVGLNGGLNIVKQNQTKNGFDIYMFQVVYLECDVFKDFLPE